MGSKANASLSGGRRAGGRSDALARLSAPEAQAILEELLALHPELRAEAECLARDRIGDVSYEAVADEVEEALRLPDLDDLNDRAGEHHGVYTDPEEAAWELLWEELAPFLSEMQRQLDLGMRRAAVETLQGVLLGLYRLRGEEGDVVSWAPDFPKEAARMVVELWLGKVDVRGIPIRRPMRGPAKAHLPTAFYDFVDKQLPAWAGMLHSTLRDR